MFATRTQTHRTITLVAAVGVVAVAVVAAARWEPLATRYHLYRLQSDDGYLEQLIDSPLGAAQEKALREYCQTDEGRSAFFSSFIAAILGPHDYVKTLATSSTIDLDIGIASDGNPWFRAVDTRGNLTESNFFTAQGTDPEKQRLLRLHGVLRYVDGQEFTLEHYPTLTFEVEWHDPGSNERVVRARTRR